MSAGSNTIYGSCYGNVAAEVWDRHLTLAFFPTAYGSVSESTESLDGHMEYTGGSVSSNTGMTQADFDAEQTESISFNLARIQAELAAIQAQADALAADNDNQP